MAILTVSQCSNTGEITVLQSPHKEQPSGARVGDFLSSLGPERFQKASLLTGSLFFVLPSETFLAHHSSPKKPSDGLSLIIKHFLYSFQISQSLKKKHTHFPHFLKKSIPRFPGMRS